MQTLYSELGRRISPQREDNPGRTERTADDGETIDNDRALFGLYSQLGISAPAPQSDPGRTEVTRADTETVDRDRQAPHGSSVLLGADDLYRELAGDASPVAEDRGRTSVTESTESIDWDRPPIGPWT
jgi:hypothetical protein